MLSKLFGGKKDHPLAEIKAVQALIDDLPKQDAYRSLSELSGWAELLASNRDFKLEHQFAVLRLIDTTAEPFVRKLTYEYFAPHDTNQVQEHRLWQALNGWSMYIGNAYLTVLNRLINGEKSPTIKSQLPLLAAGTVRALGQQLKYLSVRYHTAHDHIWQELAKICQHAENHDYLNTLVHPNSHHTVAHEISRLLVWYGCSVNNLRPLHVHLVDRIIRHCRSSLDYTTHKQADSLFCFDLQQTSAPKRVKVSTLVQPTTRFLSMSGMRGKLDTLITVLKKNVVPEDLGLEGRYQADWVREAAQYVLNYIDKPPVRRTPRHAIKVGVSVVRGYHQVANSITQNSTEYSQHWTLENISVGGFGTMLSKKQAEGFHVGELLATQTEGTTLWSVAIVRRLHRKDETWELGAETIVRQAIPVKIRMSDSHIEQFAIGLSTEAELSSGEILLLLRLGGFIEHCVFQAELLGKRYMLQPLTLTERGTDYEIARFKLVEQL